MDEILASVLQEEESTYDKPERVYNIKHRAYFFSKSVIVYISGLKIDKIHFSIFDQLLRSATSIEANLVEASAGSSKNDFIKYYSIALKSANETKYWLCLIRDTIDIEKENITELLHEADELSKIIASIIISTKK